MYDEVMQSADSKLWEITMKAEIDSMNSNSVWELVYLPEWVKPIKCKWIYKRKRNSNVKVETYMAKLVAKGHTQKKGIDYEETYTPVSMLKSMLSIKFSNKNGGIHLITNHHNNPYILLNFKVFFIKLPSSHI